MLLQRKVKSKRSDHTCLPLMQLAMQWKRAQLSYWIPFAMDATLCRPQLTTSLHPATVEMILAALTPGDLGNLWLHPLLVELLRSCCIFCGCKLPPAALIGHLQDHVDSTNPVHFHLSQMFAPSFARIVHADTKCHICALTLKFAELDIPDLLAHFAAKCPVVTQVIILVSLCDPHGRRLEHGAARGRPDHGILLRPGSSAHGCGAEVGTKRQREAPRHLQTMSQSQPPAQQNMAQALRFVGQVFVRQEQDISMLKTQDTWIFHMSKHPKVCFLCWSNAASTCH